MSVLSLEMKKRILFTAAFLLSLYSAHGKDHKGQLVSNYGRRDPRLDDKLGRSPAFSKNGVRSLITCAVICEQDDSCMSFFYNRKTKQCQGHNLNLDHTGNYDKCKGSKYYKMYQIIPEPRIRNTSKHLTEFSNRRLSTNLMNTLYGIPGVKECIKKCGETAACVFLSFNQEDRNICQFFDAVFFKDIQFLEERQGIEYYRHAKSFCDEDESFVSYPNGKTCFKFYLDSLTWEEAKDKCESLDGHLITFESENENKAVQYTIGYAGYDYRSYHIGTRRNNAGQYVYLNGDPIVYSNWKNGKPGEGDDRRCVHLKFGFYRGKWEPVDCYTVRENFICEKDFKSPY